MKNHKNLIALAIAAACAQAAHADINIGVIASFTGPAAALGGDIKRAVALMPAAIGGEKVNYILLDDATDPTTAVKNTRKLISEDHVDAIIGPNTNPNAAAMTAVVHEAKTPLVVITPYDPPADKQAWVFKSVQTAGLMVQRVVDDMVARKAKTVAFIGFADGWGEILSTSLQSSATAAHISVVANERYKRPDTSVTGQVLKVLAAKPDVIFIGASGAPAALPQIELRQRGFKGLIYQSHGVTSKDFLRIGGKSVEGALIPVGPTLVAEQLPDSMPSKPVGIAFNAAYEKLYGADSRSTFAGSTWDAWLLLGNAIPAALKTAKPGTEAFRQALRDKLESTRELVGVNGVYNMNARDHGGLDQRGRVLIEVKNARWTFVK
jgi:branched-chain amino acid transport system substrate-binding protein